MCTPQDLETLQVIGTGDIWSSINLWNIDNYIRQPTPVTTCYVVFASKAKMRSIRSLKSYIQFER